MKTIPLLTTLLLISGSIICLTGCKNKSNSDEKRVGKLEDTVSSYAIQWSTDIKRKILEDVNVPFDSTTIDSAKGNLIESTLYHKGIRTKYIGIRTSDRDTIVSIFYSKDQNFEIVRELCPGISRSYEGIRYKGYHVGLYEFRFCNGKLKEQGFTVNEVVGISKEWDEDGNLIKETDHGHLKRLNQLRSIKYYR